MQSRLLGKYLKESGLDFENVYSSIAIRAQETARHCLQEMGRYPLYIISDQLREIDQGSLEGKPKPDKNPENVNWWSYIPEGGLESQEMLYRRMKNFVYDEVISKHADTTEGSPDGTLRYLLFTHENSIACFRVGILGLSPREAWKPGIVNAGINMLSYDLKNNSWKEIHKCYTDHLSIDDSL